MSGNARTATNPWLSSRRDTITALRAQLGPNPDPARHKAAVKPLDEAVSLLTERIKYIGIDEKYDTGILTALGRKARARKRQQDTDAAKAKLDRYRADLLAKHARFDTYATQWLALDAEINHEIDLAAAEEVALRHNGKRAPWVELTLGPQPPAARRDLTQRWSAVAKYIHHLRVKRDITDPSASGISGSDTLLVNDRGHIALAHTAGDRPHATRATLRPDGGRVPSGAHQPARDPSRSLTNLAHAECLRHARRPTIPQPPLGTRNPRDLAGHRLRTRPGLTPAVPSPSRTPGPHPHDRPPSCHPDRSHCAFAAPAGRFSSNSWIRNDPYKNPANRHMSPSHVHRAPERSCKPVTTPFQGLDSAA